DEAHAAGVRRIGEMLERLRRPSPADIIDIRPTDPEVATRTPRQVYLDGVAQAKQEIVDGEIFQVVLGQRFDTPCAADPLSVYRMLRHSNPSPFMYLLNLHDDAGQPASIIGSSPEALVTVRSGEVVTHPIAGSRPRGATPEADDSLARELLDDEKERAEHLMLVDLARNDLAKVCTAGTIDASEFMDIVRSSHIMHTSSAVRGELEPGTTAIDVLRAAFPAGTPPGAPNTSCSSIWPATTWRRCAPPGRSTSASSWTSSATATSCTSARPSAVSSSPGPRPSTFCARPSRPERCPVRPNPGRCRSSTS